MLTGIVGGVGSIGYSLSDDTAAMIEALPAAAQKLRRGLEGRRSQGSNGTIETVQKAATELARAADDGASASASPPPARGVTKVQIEKSRFNVKDYLWPGALGLAAAAGQATAVLFVATWLAFLWIVVDNAAAWAW